VTAVFGEAFVRGRLLFAVGLIPVLCFTAVTLLLYEIFSPVNRSVSLLAVTCNLAGLAIEAFELHFSGRERCRGISRILLSSDRLPCFEIDLLPRILGALMAFAGLGWLLTSLSLPRSHYVHPYSQALGFLGEGSVMLWLLVKGVNARKAT
jgi:hypothetical protein